MTTELTAPSGMLESAVSAFEGARRGLQSAMDALAEKLGEPGLDGAVVRDVNGQMAGLSKVLSIAVDQEARARDERDRQNGGGGLDLVAARQEVERRLDLLVGGGAP